MDRAFDKNPHGNEVFAEVQVAHFCNHIVFREVEVMGPSVSFYEFWIMIIVVVVVEAGFRHHFVMPFDGNWHASFQKSTKSSRGSRIHKPNRHHKAKSHLWIRDTMGTGQ